MRTIKFRAWNKTKKVMVYDDEDNSSDYWDGVVASNVGLVNSILKNKENDQLEKYHWMQFTGLKDKNGKEIYEGDILLNTSGWDISGNQVIRWNEKNAWFELGDEGEKLSKYAVHEFWEIIGNIYENPELLQ